MPLRDFVVVFHWVFHKPKRSCLEKGTFLPRGDEGLFPQSIETQHGEPAESECHTSNTASVKPAAQPETQCVSVSSRDSPVTASLPGLAGAGLRTSQ